MSAAKLLALGAALAVTQASATAAPAARAAAPPVAVVVAVVRQGMPAGQHGWGLLAAGLIGLWAIGRRRIDSPGERALAPHRSARP